ncbi:MAG: HU family DNA-binding protein [Opitutales bacterium]|nr:HU family DNA-binding protein [Opitutales bacterium]
MNKSELIESIAKHSGLTQKDSEKALDAFMESVKVSLKKGDAVQLIGFGTFSVGQRAARTGVNPKTKAKIKIPAAKTVKFKAGSKLKGVL